MVKPAETSDVPDPQTTSHTQIVTEQQGKMSVITTSSVLETSRSRVSSIWQLLDLTASRLYFSAGQPSCCWFVRLTCSPFVDSFCSMYACLLLMQMLSTVGVLAAIGEAAWIVLRGNAKA